MAGTISVGEHFAPGTKVGVVPRTTDFAPANNRAAVKTVTVNDKGQVKTDGLKEHGQYWLHDGETAVGINIPGEFNDLADELTKRGEAAAEIAAENPHLANPQHLADNTTKDPGVPEHNYEKSSEPEPTPSAKYVEVSGPQRVGADIGTAYPVDPAEIQPQPAVEDVKDGTPQRVGADTGYATPVDPAEVQPAKKYEDEKGKQRVGADTGSAVPVPKTRSKREIEEAKSSSVSKARGATAPVAGTDKVPSKKAKGQPKATKAQAAKVADPAKASAKRAVKKGDES